VLRSGSATGLSPHLSPPSIPLTTAVPSLPVTAPPNLPDGVRRRLVRFALRWDQGTKAATFLPEQDVSPRDRFDRCRALVAAGELDTARELARELVNDPEAGSWGHRAVGEIFLAMEKPHRAWWNRLSSGLPSRTGACFSRRRRWPAPLRGRFFLARALARGFLYYKRSKSARAA
jgi:hypothetical protein